MLAPKTGHGENRRAIAANLYGALGEEILEIRKKALEVGFVRGRSEAAQLQGGLACVGRPASSSLALKSDMSLRVPHGSFISKHLRRSAAEKDVQPGRG